MSTILSDEAGVRTQFVLWGYAVTGDVCERGACYAEGQAETVLPCRAWDHDRSWLCTQWVAYGDEPYRHPSESWALPWVTEQQLRDHIGASS